MHRTSPAAWSRSRRYSIRSSLRHECVSGADRLRSSSDFYRGQVAESYEAERQNSSIWAREDALVAEVLEEIAPPSGALVMDAPIGTGRFAELVQRLDVRLLGVDISDEMLEQARSKAESRAWFAVGDLTLLPVESSSVDVALCIRFAHLVGRATLRGSVREFSRTIKPGGALVIGARLESLTARSNQQRRLQGFFMRRRRVAQFIRGTISSRSHSQRWLKRTLRKARFEMVGQKEVTEYSDGSFYQILVLRSTKENPARRFRSVELFGLPGSGKTTLFESMRRQPAGGVADGFAAIEKLSVLECLRRRPVATIALLFRLLPVAPELAELGARQVVVNSLRQRCVVLHPSSVTVFQEGITHEVWRQTMNGTELSDRLVSKVLPVTEATVLLDAPLSTISSRLGTKRSPGPISRSLRDQEIDGSRWRQAQAAYERLTRLLERSGTHLIRFQNSGDLRSGLDELASQMGVALISPPAPDPGPSG